MIDASRYFSDDPEATFSQMALGMVPSKILVIAYAVRDRIAAGQRVVQFTVGDFAPSEFQTPAMLKSAIVDAVHADQTNYPPAHGMTELRQAIQDNYRRDLGLEYPLDSILVASGARPVLYTAYRCLVDPGEVVLTPAPGWNNDNFSHLVGAKHVVVPSRPEDNFMPTAEGLAPYIRDARLLVLCSPMNPTGTMIRGPQLKAICERVLAENARRKKAGERLLYVVYDQVYRLLTFGDVEHVTPVGVAPEMAEYTLFADAISKCFAATGLRVGWMVAPPFIADRLRALMTHVGAWAPKPEQLATAQLLADDAATQTYLEDFKGRIRSRLDRLHDAIAGWSAAGLPVRAIAPEGAMYLSVHFDLEGRPGFPDEDSVREYLLEAGSAIIPFSAFGDHANKGWVRFSVGAVSHDDLDFCLPRLEAALRKVAQ